MFVIFYICSALHVNLCRQENIQISEDYVPIQTCLMWAQPQLANFIKYHPNQRVQKWKCVDKARLDKEREKSI